jgi:hypothetical protein
MRATSKTAGWRIFELLSSIALAGLYWISHSPYWETAVWVGGAALSVIFWSYPYYTVSDGLLTVHGGLRNLKVPASEISRIEPKERAFDWGMGKRFDVRRLNGKKVTLYLVDPEPFLSFLREEAPQAEYST